MAHQAGAYPGFCSMKRLGVFLLPPLDGMLFHRRITPSIKFAGNHLYTWVERGTVRVKCLAQEHNTMSPARARTRSARSGVERTNPEATTPPTLFLAIIGQLFAICPSISSRKSTFCRAVRRLASATSPSSVKPLRGSAFVFLPHVKRSARNRAKVLSSDKVYSIFFLQFSKLFKVSDFDKHHCFGTRRVLAMFTVSVVL